MEPSEYDVSYAIKQWLLLHGWNIIAFNPPRSQGTFSLPNPSKNPAYKGQTDTTCPDIIAIKENYLLIVECKDTNLAKIKSDVEKLRNFLINTERVDLLKRIVNNVCIANEFTFDANVEIIFAKGHGRNKYTESDIGTFFVTVKNNWNSKIIDVKTKPLDYINVEYIPISAENKKILEN